MALEVTASAMVPAPPDQVFGLISETAMYSEWVTGTDAVHELGDIPLSGQVDRDNRSSVEAFAALATRELGVQQARA